MRRRSLGLILAGLCWAAGCGGGSSHPAATTASTAPANPQTAAVRAAALAVITDPQRVCSLLTQAALSVYTGGHKGPQGLAQCQLQVLRGHLPTTATVDVLEVNGTHASVGYVTDKVAGVMILTLRKGRWLMSRVTTLPR
jgi:hypothetical protein